MQNQELHIRQLKYYHSDFTTSLKTLGYDTDTQYTYSAYAKEFLFWMQSNGIHDPKELTKAHVKEHLQYLQERPNKNSDGSLSPKTISIHLSAIKALVQYLLRKNQINNNIAVGVAVQSAKTTEYNILSIEEIQTLYSGCVAKKERAILSLFYGCGLRRTEAERLNIQDINYREQLLYVREGKGKKRRVVPMSEAVAKDLKEYFQEERKYYVRSNSEDSKKAFMLNSTGTRMRGKSFLHSLKLIIERTWDEELLSKKIVLHSLRHSIATHLLQRGVHIEYIRDFLGHEELDTTMIYTRINESTIK